MAHLVIIEDEARDAVDSEWCCSDFCAKDRDHYAGWNGCHTPEWDEWCVNCGDLIPGENGSYPN